MEKEYAKYRKAGGFKLMYSSAKQYIQDFSFKSVFDKEKTEDKREKFLKLSEEKQLKSTSEVLYSFKKKNKLSDNYSDLTDWMIVDVDINELVSGKNKDEKVLVESYLNIIGSNLTKIYPKCFIQRWKFNKIFEVLIRNRMSERMEKIMKKSPKVFKEFATKGEGARILYHYSTLADEFNDQEKKIIIWLIENSDEVPRGPYGLNYLEDSLRTLSPNFKFLAEAYLSRKKNLLILKFFKSRLKIRSWNCIKIMKMIGISKPALSFDRYKRYCEKKQNFYRREKHGLLDKKTEEYKAEKEFYDTVEDELVREGVEAFPEAFKKKRKMDYSALCFRPKTIGFINDKIKHSQRLDDLREDEEEKEES